MKNNHESILKNASLAHEEGRYTEAENAYLEILKEIPDSGPVLNALGNLYLDQSLTDKAKRVFEKAAKLNPPKGRCRHPGADNRCTIVLLDQ